MQLKKNTLLGNIRFYIILNIIILIGFVFNVTSDENIINQYVEIQLLDKVNSQNTTLRLKIGEEKNFQNLLIKALRCSNSEFDDNPEIVAYLQVKDITLKDKDKVFIFNDWTFSSSPSLKTFDHPIYDIWLTKCED